MPEVIDKLEALGHDVSGLRCKSWDEFTGPDAPHMDFVITLCDTLQGQDCPDVGSKPVTAAWPLPDPAKFKGTQVERATMINELYGMIRRRLEIFVNLPSCLARSHRAQEAPRRARRQPAGAGVRGAP